jgi:hypothetical protein
MVASWRAVGPICLVRLHARFDRTAARDPLLTLLTGGFRGPRQWGNLRSMSPRYTYFVSLAAAALLTVCGLYCVFWIFASADMAFVVCNNEYSLFSPTPRCRQPYVAMILATVLLGLALLVGLRARRAFNRTG